MAIRIITDSAADYLIPEIEKRNITCVPMAVTFGDTTYLDGKDITKEAFFEMLLEGKEFPKTSQPSPDSFLECFREAKAAGDTVIAILISGALSGTIQSAMIAKDMVEYEDIYIVDSKTATLGMRLLVDRAVVMRAQGADACQIVEELESLRTRVRLFAGLDTLEYLYKGGRLSKAQASIGSFVNLKPVITIGEKGTVELCGKQIGIRHAYKQIAKLIEEQKPDERYPVYFLYSYEKKNCAGFIQSLQKKGADITSPKLRGIGATIGAHIGAGAFGIVYVKEQ